MPKIAGLRSGYRLDFVPQRLVLSGEMIELMMYFTLAEGWRLITGDAPRFQLSPKRCAGLWDKLVR